MASYQSLHNCQKTKAPHLRQCGTFDIFDGLQLLGQLLALLHRDGLLFVLGQLLQRAALVPQVDLRADQQEGRLLAVVRYLGHPLHNTSKRERRLVSVTHS